MKLLLQVNRANLLNEPLDFLNNSVNNNVSSCSGGIPGLEIIVSGGRTFEEVLQSSSKDADLVLLGLATPDKNFMEYYKKIQKLIAPLPTTALVLAAENVSFREVLFQEDAFSKD